MEYLKSRLLARMVSVGALLMLLAGGVLAEDAPAGAGLPGGIASGTKPVETTIKLSTGVGSTFQLTLGGVFSDGVAQQNAVTVDVKNWIRDDATVRFRLWNTVDTGDLDNDWLAAVNYMQPVAAWESGSLTLSLGLHRWQFPSVLHGHSDTVVESGLVLKQGGPLAFSVLANVQTLAAGEGRKGVGGQIYYFNGTTAHPIVRKGRNALSLVHGPSFTYANRFYGTNGARVFRYETGMVYQRGAFSAEAMFRPQFALQDRIPDNKFWSFGISYVLQP